MTPVHSQVGNAIGLQQQAPISKFEQFVQSAKSFFGRAVAWVKTGTEGLATAFRGEGANAIAHTPPPLTRGEVEKAIPSSRAVFEALTALGGAPDKQPVVDTCKAALANVHTAVKLLTGDIPMGDPANAFARNDLEQLKTHLQDRLDELDRLIQQHPGMNNLRDVRASVADALKQVASRQTYLEVFSGSHPLSQEKIADCRLGWAVAAALVIDAEIAKLPSPSDPRAAALEQLKMKIVNQAAVALDQTDPTAPGDPGNLKTIAKDLGKELATAFKELGIKANAKTLAKDVNAQHVETLNMRDWKPISKEVHFVKDGVPHTFKSEIIPAAHLDPLVSSYGGKGICCQSRAEANHAVNLATTTLKDDSGSVLFQGVRHGIVSAFGLKNADERQAANLRRADELLLGVLSTKPELLQLALGQQEGDDAIELDLTSINLLTPDPLRWQFGGKDGGGSDRAITRDQLRTLQGIDGTERTITFTDKDGQERTIRIKPNIAAFSFGVNEGATRDGLGGWAMHYGGGKQSFDHVRADNALAMEKLIGDPQSGLDTLDPNSKIGKFLADPNKSDFDKQAVRELREQIRQMWNSDDYMAHKGDPHKMVSRIAVLSHLIGDTPCFNCKSGKDRTGTLDVEAKFLATRIAFAKQEALAQGLDPATVQLVPTPGPLTEAEKAMFRQFAIATGNLEVQEFNTGIGGYKTAAQHALKARLGDDDAFSRFKGGSGHVKA